MWGPQLKKLRKKKGLTQVQLAESVGITHGTISRLEKGHIKEVGSETVKKIAKSLGVTMDYLLGTTEELASQDIILRDTEAEYIVQQYAKLSDQRRKQLKDFAKFLVKEQSDD